MQTTPCGTTRFSRFLRNSFLRLLVAFAPAAGVAPAAAPAAASFGSLATMLLLLKFRYRLRAVTCGWRLSSWLRLRPSAGPSACVRWCACAGHALEDCGDGAVRGSTGFR